MTAGLRLRVDPIACDGRGLCAEILPELITLDDWGFPIIRDADVPDNLIAEAREAIRLCPKLALQLEYPPKARPRPKQPRVLDEEISPEDRQGEPSRAP
jgi:ferredoxin